MIFVLPRFGLLVWMLGSNYIPHVASKGTGTGAQTPKPPIQTSIPPRVERLEQGYQLFSVVSFSRGALPTKKGVREGTQLGDLESGVSKPDPSNLRP